MFTGITQGLFPVVTTARAPQLLTYVVALSDELLDGLVRGASVSVDGVCQTVVHVDGNQVTFQAIAETLTRTTLGELEPGRRVSIERSLRVGSELGGHELSGHVIGTGRVSRARSDQGNHELWVEVPAAWGKYIFPKGFIAVDGSSLTVGYVENGTPRETQTPDHSVSTTAFSVHLVPETLRLTRLGERTQGDHVNVELDQKTVVIVNTVERVMSERYAVKSA